MPFGGQYQRFKQALGGGGAGGSGVPSYRPLGAEERAAFGIPEGAGSYVIGKSGKPERIPETEPKPQIAGSTPKPPALPKPAATTAADVDVLSA